VTKSRYLFDINPYIINQSAADLSFASHHKTTLSVEMKKADIAMKVGDQKANTRRGIWFPDILITRTIEIPRVPQKEKNDLFYSKADLKRFQVEEHYRCHENMIKKIQAMVHGKMANEIAAAQARGASPEEIDAMMPQTSEEIFALLGAGMQLAPAQELTLASNEPAVAHGVHVQIPTEQEVGGAPSPPEHEQDDPIMMHAQPEQDLENRLEAQLQSWKHQHQQIKKQEKEQTVTEEMEDPEALKERVEAPMELELPLLAAAVAEIKFVKAPTKKVKRSLSAKSIEKDTAKDEPFENKKKVKAAMFVSGEKEPSVKKGAAWSVIEPTSPPMKTEKKTLGESMAGKKQVQPAELDCAKTSHYTKRKTKKTLTNRTDYDVGGSWGNPFEFGSLSGSSSSGSKKIEIIQPMHLRVTSPRPKNRKSSTAAKDGKYQNSAPVAEVAA
jgi:hypothetical protein